MSRKEKKYYKVVTEDMMSLGLANNPTIMQFGLGETTYQPEDNVVEGKGHSGGIWLAPNKSSAKKIVEYMRENYGVTTRVFEVEIGRILYENAYRLKTDQVTFLLELYYIFKLDNKKVMFVD